MGVPAPASRRGAPSRLSLAQRWRGLGRLMARCPVGTSPQAPRLEPDLRLSPRPARHLQISLGLSSVAWCAYRLEVAHAISLRWVLELPAWYDVIHFYLAGMEWFS